MTSTPGVGLEQLVAAIEKQLSPDNFKVELNEQVRNDQGVQIAEFDVLITGKVGSSSVNWLIECRDRPSHGPAPGSWIEQLVGRRQRFHFDKVIAVSTTGFADGAVDYAQREGILLRTVQRADEIVGDFKVKRVVYSQHEVKLTGDVQATIDKAPSEVATEGSIELRELDGDTWALPLDFVAARVDLGAVPDRFNFIHEEVLNLRVSGQECLAHNVEIPIEKSTKLYDSRALIVDVYAEGQRVIGQEAAFHFDTPEGQFPVRLRITEQDGESLAKAIIPNLSRSHGIRQTQVRLFHRTPARLRQRQAGIAFVSKK